MTKRILHIQAISSDMNRVIGTGLDQIYQAYIQGNTEDFTGYSPEPMRDMIGV